MTRYLLVLLFCLFQQLCFGQYIPYSYDDMDTVKYYEIYEYGALNGEKDAYDSMMYYRKLKGNQCPLYKLIYDTNQILVAEYTVCGDCNVGTNKSYYENGSIRRVSNFKRYYGKDWAHIYKNGYCNVLDGKQVFFNRDGDTSYVENWNNGEFLSQIPEQNLCEIWGVDLVLNDSVLNDSAISVEQIKNLVFKTKYKNQRTEKKLVFSLSLRKQHKQYSYQTEIYRSPDFSDSRVPKKISEEIYKRMDPQNLEYYQIFIEAIIEEPYGFQFQLQLKN